ncbi:Nepenthesin [Bertholletia excelsa]
MSCFNPQLSSSYSNRPCISSSDRTYEVSYADGSYSSGTYSCDTVTLDDVKTKIQFGCAQHFHGDFSNVDGMLGLGPGQFSFVSQIASKAFSYCLPSVGSFIGHLRFGNQATNAHKFTPLEIDSNYYVKVLEITVGRKKLKLPESMSSSPGAILDSGTTITRLPKSAYDDLKSAFRELMTSYTPAPPEDILDTCYYPTGLKNVMIPNIVMHFEGADVSLHPAGILWAVPKSPIKLCLAFAAKNSREGGKGPAIIGSTQQKTMDVLYDLERRTVGFAMNGCH